MDPIWDELEDRVEQIFAATEQLREAVGDGKTTRQLLESIFRHVHSLKASASSNDLDDLARLAHQFENLLHALRTGKVRLDNEVLRAFDDTSDAMFESLRQPETPNLNSYAALCARLESLSAETAGSSREAEFVLKAVPAEIWLSLGEDEKHRLEQSLGEGATLFLVSTSFDLVNFDQLFQDLKAKLTQSGELISTAPKVHAERPDKIDFRILHASDSELAQLRTDLAGFENVECSEVSQPPLKSTGTKSETATSEKESTSGGPQLIRIDLNDLDRLISSTHQLFRDTRKCLDELLERSDKSSNSLPRISALDASFLNLASELVNLRMVTIDRVLQRAFRAGRSVAAAAGKEIDFKVIGRDLKIDKSLSDAIADPLIHLVRNAVDHGIESGTRRTEAGKNRRGTICIEATSLQGQTRIRVTDDGRGIDPELVRTAARKLGVLTDDRQIDIDKSLRLIFLSGLTTANAISETSGRGVGLDVVETSIEAVGGAIKVDSEPGAGAVFEIRLPVTFSLLDVLKIQVGRFSYLVDAAQVGSSELGGEVLRVEDLLGQERPGSKSALLLTCGFVGDQLSISLNKNETFQPEQVLVRNLGSHGGRWVGVSGAAEMRDGSVALLLDLPALIARYRYATSHF